MALHLIEKAVHSRSPADQGRQIALHDRQHLPLDRLRESRDEPLIPAEVSETSQAGNRVEGDGESPPPSLGALPAEKPSGRGVEAERPSGKPST